MAVPPATSASPHLYEQLAQDLTRLIRDGTLRSGDRAPSVRKLVAQQRVSPATVIKAYELLESRGLVVARVKSGFYVRSPPPPRLATPLISQPPANSQPVNMGGLVMKVVGALSQPGLVQLGVAVPPAEFLPNRELHRALAAAARRQPVLANTCDPGPGLLALRSEIARQALDAGCSLSPADIVVLNGATEALHLCLRAVTQPGETVAVESPTYFGILQVIEMLGLRVCELPSRADEGIELEGLEARLVRARVKACVLSPNFSNPLGSCMPDDNKLRLVELLAARGIPLVEDDIYGSLAFDTGRPRSAKAFDRQGLVLWCGSFSKTLAPGYRIGWAAPGRYLPIVHQLKHTSSLGNPAVTQLALAEFLATGGFERHLRRMRRLYADQMERMRHAIAEYFPAGTRVTHPRGGQVLWLELPDCTDALELHRVALRNGISIAPGPIFSAGQRFQNCVRLSFTARWSERTEQAVKRLAALAARARD